MSEEKEISVESKIVEKLEAIREEICFQNTVSREDLIDAARHVGFCDEDKLCRYIGDQISAALEPLSEKIDKNPNLHWSSPNRYETVSITKVLIELKETIDKNGKELTSAVKSVAREIKKLTDDKDQKDQTKISKEFDAQKRKNSLKHESYRSRDEYRSRWVYPVSGPNEETDEQLRSLFPPFEAEVWSNQLLMPSLLKIQYLEIFLAAPDLFGRLIAQIPNEALRSPVAVQLDLLARDMFDHGIEPTFDRMMLRYEDSAMKSFLIELDADAAEKGLFDALADDEKRETILRDVVLGFERAKTLREEPKHVSILREKETSPEEKLQKLLALQRETREKRQQQETA